MTQRKPQHGLIPSFKNCAHNVALSRLIQLYLTELAQEKLPRHSDTPSAFANKVLPGPSPQAARQTPR